MRKTKLSAQWDPVLESDQMIAHDAGRYGCARFNFSHGDHAEQKGPFGPAKTYPEELGLPVAALLDTKGPEIRIGKFENGKVELKKGQLFTLTTKEITGNQDQVSISYKDLLKDVEEGMTILLTTV